MAFFTSKADLNVGLVNPYVLNSTGIAQGFGSVIINFFDPTAGLPVAPADGDRYVAAATARGWVINDIEQYSSSLAKWVNLQPVSGQLVWMTALATPNMRIWNPLSVAWEIPAIDMGAQVPVNPSTTNALVRFSNTTGGQKNSGVLLSDANDMSGLTGTEFTPVAANPGAVPANTIWFDSTHANRPTINANPFVQGPAGAVTTNTIPTFNAASNLLQGTTVAIDPSNNITGANSLQVAAYEDFTETVAAPADPAAGTLRLYSLTDNTLRMITSTGVSSIIAPNALLVTSSGSVTIPTNVSQVIATFWAGGGGGGGFSSAGSATGGAGGSGSAVISYPISLLGVASLTITIGAGGAGGATGSQGSVGSNTTVVWTRTLTAYGGGGGGSSSSNWGGGGGGGGGSNSAGSVGGNGGVGVGGTGGAGGTADPSASSTNWGIYGAAGGAGSTGANTPGPGAGSDGTFVGGFSSSGAGGGGGANAAGGTFGGVGGSMILGQAGGAHADFGGSGGGGGYGASGSNTGYGGAGGSSLVSPTGTTGASGGCLLIFH